MFMYNNVVAFTQNAHVLQYISTRIRIQSRLIFLYCFLLYFYC